MNPRKELFCYYYVEDGNATKAAIRAGYSKRSARQHGQVLLQKHDIIEKINEIKSTIIARHKITIDDVIQQLAHIGFSNLNDILYVEDGFIKLKEGGDIDALEQIKLVNFKKVFKSGFSKKYALSLKRADRVKALSELARILGYHDKPKESIADNKKVASILTERLSSYLEKKKDQ